MDSNLERSLHRLILANGERVMHKWVHYLDVYERHFRRFVDRKPVVLEIGVAGGGSLRLWQSYLFTIEHFEHHRSLSIHPQVRNVGGDQGERSRKKGGCPRETKRFSPQHGRRWIPVLTRLKVR